MPSVLKCTAALCLISLAFSAGSASHACTLSDAASFTDVLYAMADPVVGAQPWSRMASFNVASSGSGLRYQRWRSTSRGGR